ncbi:MULTISPECIES: TOMM precursor leader peptide-binding protein [Streptomyces]|uniref:TOMM precursor leader peptide-binding protein n=1 Tax=Streptomyces TaxID=1883 RepID=UPI001C8D1CB3|nr:MULTISPECIES: TOMM precursor leader peptide-binding protein [Streptomyces]UBI36099.1 TOMM precursor leader peptide-binding protein [Streptomyces mobaraensis]UKW28694.1 TOMM precursor leader peptide-binding protein [Streptomyces sp. TYQ1024]
MTRTDVLVSGDGGVLHHALDEVLGGRPAVAAVVTATDARATDDDHDGALRRATTLGVPFLPVWTEGDRAVVGPVVRPGVPGCHRCLGMRRAHAPDRAVARAVLGHAPDLYTLPSPLLTAPAVTLTARLVAERLTAPDAPAARSMTVVGLRALDVSTHAFLPDPCCPVCGGLPDDAPTAVPRALAPRPKPRPGLRLRWPDTALLRALLADPETGLVRGVTQATAAVPLARAPLALPDGGEAEAGLGAGPDRDTATAAALLEGAERYASVRPRARRTVVRAAYADVRDDAVDPRTLGLHPDSHYDVPGFPFRRFAEDRVTEWVWAWSHGRARPVLLPRSYAYFLSADERDPGDRGFVFEVSNGCALGSCSEEAQLHGLLEVAERDAFFTAWYRRTPLDAIDPGSARDRTVPLLVEHLAQLTGHRVHLLDATLEQEIPCVVALAVDEDERPDTPRAALAAGAHPDPEQAAVRALMELGPHLSLLAARYPARRERARQLALDPSGITHPADHALVAAAPEFSGRLAFLLEGRPPRAFAEVHRGRRLPRHHDDLTDDLRDLVRRYLDTGFDVLAVDQTTAELAALDLTAVKVVVPGTAPVTYGHLMRRTEGLPRLTGELSTDPHPFP